MVMERGIPDFGRGGSDFYGDQTAAEMFTKNFFVDFDDDPSDFEAKSIGFTATTASSFNNSESSLNSMNLGKRQSVVDQNNYLDLSVVSESTADGNPSSSTSPDAAGLDSPEDSDVFSDMMLNYISQMLMDEEMEGKFDGYIEEPALLATEKPFSDILGQSLQFSPDQPPLYSSLSPDSFTDGRGGGDANSLLVDDTNGSSWPYDPVEYKQLQMNPVHVDYNFGSDTKLSFSNTVSNVVDGLDTLSVSEFVMDSNSAWQFQRGLEEARKFLPSDDKLVIDIGANGFHAEDLVANVKTEKNVDGEHYLTSYSASETRGLKNPHDEEVDVLEERNSTSYYGSEARGRKNPHDEELDVLEGRNNKQSAFSTEEPTDRKLFDDVLLCSNEGGKCTSSIEELRIELQNEANKRSQSSNSRGSGGGKGGRGKKQPKKEVVDLRTLLIHCAQSVATDDRRSANDTLKQIRQHSDPHGDANQRLAHCFADGLEARLAGTGSQIYHSMISKRIAVMDVLKAYRLFMAACPFKKLSYFFSNQTILDVSENASRLHIVDYGVYYGFQWPCFMQRLSKRPGGPPKLKITGIDNPLPGFRPSELIDETGRRLADYARKFGIDFEYKAIAARWETITVEDINIDPDEVLVVNCMFKLKNQLDETVMVDSPRDMILNTIRKLNPAVFIHGIVNGSFSAPFFVTRFREALFHYSALFDMIETNVPREDESRQLIERIFFGREALNVIACEGPERIERPETYKQTQVRTIRAGFTQLPLNKDLVAKAKYKVKGYYHKDFVVDEDSKWLLQGWKGRILYASSTWKPNPTY